MFSRTIIAFFVRYKIAAVARCVLTWLNGSKSTIVLSLSSFTYVCLTYFVTCYYCTLAALSFDDCPLTLAALLHLLFSSPSVSLKGGH